MGITVKRYHPLYKWQFHGELLIIVYDLKHNCEDYFAYNEWIQGKHQKEMCILRKHPYIRKGG